MRRLVVEVEESVDEAIQWVVFEPNNETTWTKARLQVEAYLTRKWRAGELVGATCAEAFYVKCGPETMTQVDLDNGRMVMEIGIAPSRPAEFVVIKVTQLAAADQSDPLAAFHFRIEWGGSQAGFSEVTGLDSETDALDYRDGADSGATVRKMTGRAKFEGITLKRGLTHDRAFADWLLTLMGEPRDVVISLWDERRAQVMRWSVRGARPVKAVGALNPKGNAVAIEEIELYAEGIQVERE